MNQNRPQGRKPQAASGSASVNKRGSGLGTGPVGRGGKASSSAQTSRPSFSRPQRVSSTSNVSNSRPVTRSGGKSPLALIVVAAAVLLGGGGGLSALLGGNSDTTPIPENTYISDTAIPSGQSTNNQSNSWQNSSSQSSNSSGKADTTVAAGAREKRTEILGNSKDTVTIMVYMCGTDLESKSGMATSDLTEMTKANLGSNVNLLVYTGGCTKWQNNIISNQVNQIYQVKDGGVICLEKDMGNAAMTRPETLSSYIQYCAENYPANRMELIFWDHGGGSLSGYGYDEKNPRSGSMTLAGINQALKASGVTFDFIGFDACLMATMENALMLCPYADYMIASEETEPGVGWYYTNWLTKLGSNTSMPTVEIGKNIVDDFVDVCAQSCRGQKTTLSVVDLAELEATIPAKFADFAKSTSELIEQQQYQTVSEARNNCREFASSSKIDQVDLINLANNMKTAEGTALVKALQGAVKYNRTSTNMTNANGLSIYFPYKKVSNVDTAVKTYEAIGMDESYAECIKAFASLEVSGQVAAGGIGASSPVPSLFGSIPGGSAMGSDAIGQLLGSFLGGDFGSIAGLSGSNTGFLSGRAMDVDAMAQYLAEHQFDPSGLVWRRNSSGQTVLSLPEEQWSLVQMLALNLFVDDGAGFIDLGVDNVFEFDDAGNLIADLAPAWLAIEGQPVAYYYQDSTDDAVMGVVPVMLNGQRAELQIVFDAERPEGYVSGVRTVYANGETETIAKSTTELQIGDQIDFLCDYYDYNGSYQDSYYLGEPITVTGELQLSMLNIEGTVQVTYRLTDIYNQNYWTPAAN